MTGSPDPDAAHRIRVMLGRRSMDFTELQRLTGLSWQRLYPAAVRGMEAGLIGQAGRGSEWRLVWIGEGAADDRGGGGAGQG